MSLILCLETATDICSVALSLDGVCVSDLTLSERKQHSATLIPNVKRCLEEYGATVRQIQAVALSEGPGSYTGLRIGASTAKAICYTMKIPLIAISSLEALAFPFLNKMKSDFDYVLPTIDARRMEVYTAVFKKNGDELKMAHNLILDRLSLEKIFTIYPKALMCGNGIRKIEGLVKKNDPVFMRHTEASAVNLCQIAHAHYVKNGFVSVANFAPNYYKGPNITTPKKSIM